MNMSVGEERRKRKGGENYSKPRYTTPSPFVSPVVF